MPFEEARPSSDTPASPEVSSFELPADPEITLDDGPEAMLDAAYSTALASQAGASDNGRDDDEALPEDLFASPDLMDMVRAFGLPSLVPPERLQDFFTLADDMLDDIAPNGGSELCLTWEIINANWEARRLRKMVASVVSMGEENALIEALGYSRREKDSGPRRAIGIALSGYYSAAGSTAHAKLVRDLRLRGYTIERVKIAGLGHALPHLKSIELMLASCSFRRNSAINAIRRGREASAARLTAPVVGETSPA